MAAIIEALIGPLGGVLAALAGAVGIWLRGRHTGRRDAEQNAVMKDVENAKRIRERADAARSDTGGGDAVDRLRDHGRLRD